MSNLILEQDMSTLVNVMNPAKPPNPYITLFSLSDMLKHSIFSRNLTIIISNMLKQKKNEIV